MGEKIFRVKVPATSANLGPGFDSLGMAVNCYNHFAFRLASNEIPNEHLCLASYQHAAAGLGVTLPAVDVETQAEIPIARGLGSSAACIAAGILAAEFFSGRPISMADKLRLATEIEGHPDNVAPALLGGVVSSVYRNGDVHSCPIPLAKPLTLLALVPDQALTTHEARAVLPKQVSYADAVFNVSHVSLLVSALASGAYDLLKEAFQDRLHQPYRSGLIPGFNEILDSAYTLGAKGAFLSGAGSTIMVVEPAEQTEALLRAYLSQHEWQWELRKLKIDLQGATAV